MAGNAPITTYPSMIGTPGGIPSANTVEYFEKGIDEQGPYYLVQYYINNWSDSDAFINALLGYTSTTGSGSGGVIKRMPHAYPLSPNLLCRRARCVAPGSAKFTSTGLPDFYGGALIQAEYRIPQWQSGADRNEQIDPDTPVLFCTQQIDHTTETYTIPGREMMFGTVNSDGTYTAGANHTKQDFRIRVPVTNLSLTFHLSPNLYVATSTIRQIAGCVNGPTSFLGAPAQCVLFTGCHTTRDYDSAGNVIQNITLTFSERRSNQTWNMLPDPVDLTWKAVGIGTTPPYPQADFNQYIFGF